MIDADKVVILDHHDLHLEADRMRMAEEYKARKAGRCKSGREKVSRAG